MREIELKLMLDESQAKRLRSAATFTSLNASPARTQTLTSTYFDTADGALRSARIALRLRKRGRAWIQTVKRSTAEIENGLSSPEEFETPLSGGDLALNRISDHDLREELLGLARVGLEPRVKTTFRRTMREIALPGSGAVELAIDQGELSCGNVSEPFIEAELELKSGSARQLYDLAAQLVQHGPVRFSLQSKSERAYRLGDQGAPRNPLRKARPVSLPQGVTVEAAAMAILSEGFAHAMPNLARVIDTPNDPNGPHQLRVGLRRMRAALTAFRPVLGRETLAPWAAQASTIAALAGELRDLDVLGGELIKDLSKLQPDEPGFKILRLAITERRAEVAERVLPLLRNTDTTAFVLRFGGFLEGRGWLDPGDHGQTKRLAAPAAAFARRTLNKRWKAVRAYGGRIQDLTIDERHEMRKEIKKLRYLVDAFRSLYAADDVAGFTRIVKKLQTAFGALNDSAMAELILMQPGAPGANDPAVARAAGRVIGHLLARSDALWPSAVGGWNELAKRRPFWHG